MPNLPLTLLTHLFEFVYFFVYCWDFILDFLNSASQFLFFGFGIDNISIDLVDGEKNGDRVENQLIEKFDTLVDCIRLGERLYSYILRINFKIASVDASLESMVPRSKFEKLSAYPVVLDLIIRVVSFGEVDERTWGDSEQYWEKFVEGKHIYEDKIIKNSILYLRLNSFAVFNQIQDHEWI